LFLNEILFWEKKRHSKAVKTVRGTSQVLLLMQVFLSRNDLKPENPKGRQAALFFKLCRYSFWHREPRNNECAKPTPSIGSSARHFKLWWQNGRGLAD